MSSKRVYKNPKRNERVRKMRRRRRIRFLLAFFALCLIVFAILSVTVLFPITKIVSSDCGKYTAEQIISASKIEEGDNLIINGWKSDQKRICTSLPYIKSVKFSKSFDGTLKISAKSAYEKYLINSPDGLFLTDPDLKILDVDAQASEDIICVYTYGSISGAKGETAKFSDDTDKELFDFVTRKLEEYKIDYTVVDISKSYNISVLVSSRFVIELGSKSAFDEKLAHIAIMVERILLSISSRPRESILSAPSAIRVISRSI